MMLQPPKQKRCRRCSEDKHPAEYASYQLAGRTQVRNICKDCKRIEAREYASKNRERAKDLKLRSRFGITLPEYGEIYESQSGRCICGNWKPYLSEKGGRTLAVDHCHITGEVRGLLCSHCNTLLGSLENDIPRVKKLMDYADYSIIKAIQKRTLPWLRSIFGSQADDPIYRAARLVEEVIELAQAVGLHEDSIHALIEYVYTRPKGDPSQEIGGVVLTLLALAEALGIDAEDAVVNEFERCMNMDDEQKTRMKNKLRPVARAA